MRLQVGDEAFRQAAQQFFGKCNEKSQTSKESWRIGEECWSDEGEAVDGGQLGPGANDLVREKTR